MVKKVDYKGEEYLVAEGYIGERIPCPICETDVIVKEFCGKCGFAQSNNDAVNPEARLKSAQQYVNYLYKIREDHIEKLQKVQSQLETAVNNGWKPTEISI